MTLMVYNGTADAVLIETLWNVKDVWCALCDHLACRINRNIMECKGTEAKTGVEAGEKY